jgi:hypothetical protein
LGGDAYVSTADSVPAQLAEVLGAEIGDLVLLQVFTVVRADWYAERVRREISVAGLTLNADWSINSWVIFSESSGWART